MGKRSALRRLGCHQQQILCQDVFFSTPIPLLLALSNIKSRLTVRGGGRILVRAEYGIRPIAVKL